MVDRNSQIRHPGLEYGSVDELLEANYFDILACISSGSLHPGEGVATQLLLDTCELQLGNRVLEIGCGPGWTTRALLQAGINVTVVEPSRKMIDALKYYCDTENIPLPVCINSKIEKLSHTTTRSAKYDLVLLECVTGFIQDKRAALIQIEKVLRKKGRIGVLDVHYTTTPPKEILERLKSIVGVPVEVYYRHDWEDLFQRHNCLSFESFSLSLPEEDAATDLIENSDIHKAFPKISDSDIGSIIEYFSNANSVFLENKKYMAGHIAVWEIR